MSRKRILVTGHAGFIGKHIVPMLQDKYDVIGCDISEGGDILKLQNFPASIVLHLAALTSVSESHNHRASYHYVNTVGTLHLANLCIQQKAKLYYLSTAAILDSESSPYARSKALAQEILDSMHPLLQCVTFMPFNIYSDNPKKGTLLYNFLHNNTLEIYGNGTHSRDFIHIDTVCSIIKQAIDDNWYPCTVEVGTGKSYTVKQIAKIFQKYTDKKIVYKPGITEVRKSLADIHFLKNHYRGAINDTLEADIKRMVLSRN